MSNSLHLAIRGSGIHLHAALQPDSLPELLALIQKHRVDEPISFDPMRHERREGRGRFGRPFPEHDQTPLEPLSDAAVAIKQRLGSLTQGELPPLLPSLSMGDKLLLLIAWLEMKSPLPLRKSALRDLFAQLKEPAPANPGRDIKNLAQDGLLLVTHDRQGIQILEQGWQRLGGLLSDGEGDGNPVLA